MYYVMNAQFSLNNMHKGGLKGKSFTEQLELAN